jgi:hypothetical protein
MSDKLANTRSITISTNSSHFDKGSTDQPGGRLFSGALITGCALIATLALGAIFDTPQSGSIGEAVAAKVFVDSPRQADVLAVEAMKIVPADSLRKDLSWSPLTGDGSN